MEANRTMNAIRVKENFFTGELCANLSLPERYNTISIPMITHKPMNTSLFSSPHCFTRSALDKNFTARASSTKPNTTFTSVIHPPDFGNDCSQLGNMANNAKGRPSAKPKPAAPAVSGHAPWSTTPTSNVPRIGPVQEKETIASVAAIKNIPPILPIPDFESALFASPAGKPISNKPKKDKAKVTNTAKNRRLSQTLVEILFNISGLMFARWNGIVIRI